MIDDYTTHFCVIISSTGLLLFLHDVVLFFFFIIEGWVLWQRSLLSHSGDVWDMTFQKVIVSFTASRVA